MLIFQGVTMVSFPFQNGQQQIHGVGPPPARQTASPDFSKLRSGLEQLRSCAVSLWMGKKMGAIIAAGESVAGWILLEPTFGSYVG